MRIKGLTIGGQRGLDPTMTFTRRIPILAYHKADRTCWLWYLELHRSIADERRAFRYFRMRGQQDRRIWQFWNWSIVFCWQDQGRFRNYRHQRQSKLSRLFGVDFES